MTDSQRIKALRKELRATKKELAEVKASETLWITRWNTVFNFVCNQIFESDKNMLDDGDVHMLYTVKAAMELVKRAEAKDNPDEPGGGSEAPDLR